MSYVGSVHVADSLGLAMSDVPLIAHLAELAALTAEEVESLGARCRSQEELGELLAEIEFWARPGDPMIGMAAKGYYKGPLAKDLMATGGRDRLRSKLRASGYESGLYNQYDSQRAAEIQAHMLPTIPDLGGLDVQVHFRPMDAVSGDFYDFFPLSDGRYGVALGDVTGHGVSAALVMAMAKKILKMVAREDLGPARTLIQANRELSQELDPQTFVTMMYGVIDPGSGSLRFARAGHEPPLLIPASGKIQAFKPPGVAVGLRSCETFEQTIKETALTLEPGSTVVLYTDGCTELVNGDGVELGTPGLARMVRQALGQPEPLRALVAGLDAYQQTPLADDQTLLLLRRPSGDASLLGARATPAGLAS